MEHVDIRLETVIIGFIDNLSSNTGRLASEVARDLAWIGVGIQKEGGIHLVGPLGISRPLAELDLGDEKRKVSFWIESDLITELESEFRGSLRGALRKAIRLGALAIKPEEAKIRGPFGLERPLLSITISELKDERARVAYNRLAH